MRYQARMWRRVGMWMIWATSPQPMRPTLRILWGEADVFDVREVSWSILGGACGIGGGRV